MGSAFRNGAERNFYLNLWGVKCPRKNHERPVITVRFQRFFNVEKLNLDPCHKISLELSPVDPISRHCSDLYKTA